MKYLVRDKYLNRIINLQNTPDIKVITGMRRSGKSVLLNEFIGYIKEKDTNANIIFANLQDVESEALLEYHCLHKYAMDNYKDGMHNILIIGKYVFYRGKTSLVDEIRYKYVEEYLLKLYIV